MIKAYSTDNELLAQLAKQDRLAYQQLYASYYNMVAYFVTHNNGTEENAQDLFQEVIIVLYEKTKNSELKLSSSLKTYIYSIARNLWLKQLDKNKRMGKVKDFEDHIPIKDTPYDTTLDDHLTALEKALQRLGEKCREILIGFYYQKKSTEELALELSFSGADSVKTQKYKCVQKLKDLMNGFTN